MNLKYHEIYDGPEYILYHYFVMLEFKDIPQKLKSGYFHHRLISNLKGELEK